MNTSEYQVGAWHVSPSQLRLTRQDEGKNQEETLPPKVFEVLLQLVQQSGQTVSRQTLIDTIWQGNQAVGSRGITNAIYMLRKLLNNGDEEAIRTIAKTGYQLLLLPVIEIPAQATAEPAEVRPDPSLKKRGITGLLAITLGLLALLMWQRWPQTTERLPEYGEAKPLTYLEGVEETPALSPDGRYLAFMWERDREPGRIFIQDLQQPSASLRQISFGNENESNPSWSPDGSQLAFLRLNDSGQCDVWIKSLDTLEEHRITTCVQERFHHVLSWSPSGRYLAVVDKVPQQEHSAVFLYDLNSHQRRQLTQPQQGQRDTQLIWAHQKDELAFVRSQGAYWADLHTVDINGNERQLTFDRAAIHGLSWSRDDQKIVINTMRDGGHSLWQLQLDSGSLRPLYRDFTPFNIVALAKPDHYAFSRHASQEYLQGWAGERSQDIDSAGRDLYGNLSPDGEQMAFLSNRSGQFEVWLAARDGSNARPLTQKEGLVELPAWSLDGQRLVVPLAATDSNLSRILMFDLVSGQKRTLLQESFQFRNPHWSPDGQSLLLASNRSGSWQIWQLELQSGQMQQLTDNGGLFARRDPQGRLWFTRPNEAGLWLKEGDGPSQRVIDDLASDDWGNWALTADGILYLHRATEADQLLLWQAGKVTVQQTFARGSIKINRSLSRDQQGNLVLTRLGRREANIVAIAPL
ncbi:winged helix-turn-helix domain-containing protein [uncultured Ferrimonas sp.]|uniref:winged helix-turn-helix domain-containing protein n=1 Tax=uncultured Ferrimonas sp. TaxID=432640 RepID=UPI00260DBCE6|nr:winged helix-turn-helix domain-containing protein [uncultured Ferrimonas sp.]